MSILVLLAATCLSPISVDRGTITSTYGWRILPGQIEKSIHVGVDIRARLREPVRSVTWGDVIFASQDLQGSGGIMIEILFLELGVPTVVRYAHLNKVNVAVGDKVKRYQIIGTVGSTGNSTGPHLHIEVIKETNGRIRSYTNPERFLCKYKRNIQIPHFKITSKLSLEK